MNLLALLLAFVSRELLYSWGLLGTSIVAGLTILLIVLRATNIIKWRLIWVFAPMLFWAGFIAFIRFII